MNLAVVVLILTFGSAPVLAVPLTRVEALPAGVFEIAGVLAKYRYGSFQVHEFAIRGTRMVFLVSHGPNIEEAVFVITDLRGGVASVVALGKRQLYDWAVSPSGSSYAILFADEHNAPTLRTFSIDGLQISRVALDGNPTRLAYTQDQFVALTDTGRVQGQSGRAFRELGKDLFTSPGGAKTLISMPGNRIAVVNTTSADVAIIDTLSGLQFVRRSLSRLLWESDREF